MANPVYLHTDTILTAARERGRAASAQTKRDPDTGRQWWLYCGYRDFVCYLEQLEAEKGIVHERQR